MQIASIGSGSKGNATLIRSGSTLLLLDCGFSLPRLRFGMAELGHQLSDISAVLVTHEHSDHIAGILPLVKEYQISTFLSAGSARALSKKGVYPNLHFVTPGIPFRLGELEILPVLVPHDANEPVQYVFSNGDGKLGVLTDLGHVSYGVQTYFGDCTELLLEFNYDQQLLAEGSYPPSLKQRIAGPHGHLSNDQALELLKKAKIEGLRKLIIGHISQNNNDPKLVQSMLEQHLQSCHNKPEVIYASQEKGFDWVDCR